MHLLRRASIGLLLALVLLPIPGPAQNVFTYTIFTVNESNHRAWITIQDLGKTRNLDWGWVNAKGSREWGSGNYTLGGFYYVRFEFQGANGTICDTRAQLSINKSASHSKIGSIVYGRFDASKGSRGCWIDVVRVGT